MRNHVLLNEVEHSFNKRKFRKYKLCGLLLSKLEQHTGALHFFSKQLNNTKKLQADFRFLLTRFY